MDSKLGAEGRKDLFDWLSKQLSELSSFAEAAQLLKPASSAMTVWSGYSEFCFYIFYAIYQISSNAHYSWNKMYDGFFLG